MKKIFAILSLVALAIPATSYAQVIKLNVPFVYQAAGGSWNDPRVADGCEEAAILMAVNWTHRSVMTPTQLNSEIINLSEYEKIELGFFEDTSAADTAKLMKDYYGQESELRYDISVEDLKLALAAGHIAIVPINGQILNNPHYRKPGPPRHMIVIIGYDQNKDQFIVNDPGTRFGRGQRFSARRIQNALQDYPSGIHRTVEIIRTAMIEVF